MKLKVILPALAIMMLALAPQAHPFGVELEWEPSPSTDVKGYRVYVTTIQGDYSQATTMDVGDVLVCLITQLQLGTMHYFKVTALDWEGKESVSSNEVRTDGIGTPGDIGEPPAPPGGTGGGGCYIKSIFSEPQDAQGGT